MATNDEVQGSLNADQCAALEKESFRAFRHEEISEAQHYINCQIAHWHRCRWKCPFSEYIGHRIRADEHIGNTVPDAVKAEYPPATGAWKIAPGDIIYFPRGVPKDAMADNKRQYGHRYRVDAEVKTKPATVTAAAGLGVLIPTAICI